MTRRARFPLAGLRSPASPNRDFVLVPKYVWQDFHKEWEEIDRRYPLFVEGFTDGDREAMRGMRQLAREELRRKVRELAEFELRELGGRPGQSFLVPV